MYNESDVYTRFRSDTFGALAHVTEVLIDAVEADAAAGKVYNEASESDCAYVSTPGIATLPRQRRDLNLWPLDPRSSFTQYTHENMANDVCLLCPDSPGHGRACGEFFKTLPPPLDVNTVMCMSLPVVPKTRCMLMFMRCRDSTPFTDKDTELVRRYKPATSRVLQRGFLRQFNPGVRARPDGSTAPSSLPIHELLGRLSGTENRILEHLRLRVTERVIAETLGRSPHTVHVHVKSIYRKLMVTSRRQLLEVLDQDGGTAEPFTLGGTTLHFSPDLKMG
jgi:DNA-binding CsgD family transcriptional regulator